MNILIVEDELLVAEFLQNILTKNNYTVVAIADTISSAIDALAKNPDVCLVDIRLAENNSGIDLGDLLHTKRVPFIYLTANNEANTIQLAAKTQPEAFLTKPFNIRDIISTLDLLKFKLQNKKCLPIKTNQGVIEVPLHDIIYMKADNVYTEVYTTYNKCYVERKTLKEMGSLLSTDFIRVHRSYIVNRTHIKAKKPASLVINNIEIPISKTYRKSSDTL